MTETDGVCPTQTSRVAPRRCKTDGLLHRFSRPTAERRQVKGRTKGQLHAAVIKTNALQRFGNTRYEK